MNQKIGMQKKLEDAFGGRLVKPKDFLLFMESVSGFDGGESLEEYDKCVRFSQDQQARWGVEWGFSDADNPNYEAGKCAKDWDDIVQRLLQNIPDTYSHYQSYIKSVEDYYKMVPIGLAIERAASCYANKPLIRFFSNFKVSLSRLAYSLGARSWGVWLLTTAVYPRGSVGRAQFYAKTLKDWESNP